MPKPRLVVVGGGFAGAAVAHDPKLTAACDVTLIDAKDYFEVSWASLRALVEPALGARIVWKHTEHLKGAATLVVGVVKRVTDAAVELQDGKSIPYDYLVLAPGAAGGAGKAAHASMEERLAYYAAEAARIAAAGSVLIVGGGPTGVELAAEIATEHPGKKVTLVHSGGVLAQQLCASASAALKEELTKMGVTVLTNTKLTKDGSGRFGSTTDKGENAAAELVYDCCGTKPATEWVTAKGGHAAIKLSDSGCIVVTKQLHVPDAPNVFALGDAAETGDAKQAYLAVNNQVPTVVANILGSLAAPPAPLKEAPTGPAGVMIVTLGRANGVAQLPGGYVASGWALSWLPTLIKSRWLFIDKVRGEHGV